MTQNYFFCINIIEYTPLKVGHLKISTGQQCEIEIEKIYPYAGKPEMF